MKNNDLKVETILAHLSESGDINDPYGASHMPIYQTATFDLKKQGDDPYDYTRSGNPTRESLERALSKVCLGLGAILTHTGLGAVALVLESILKIGDEVLIDQDTYGGTFRLLKNYRDRLNTQLNFVDFTNYDEVENILKRKKIKMILIESPTNPGLKIIDLKRVASLSKKYNSIFVVDNSLATFISQRPLELGADISLFSTTKYISGHGSVIGGAVVSNREDLLKDLRFSANAQGRSQNPMDVYIISLGLPSLPVRLKAHEERAIELATWLKKSDKVLKVNYPGLLEHPQHDLAKTQMSCFSGLMTVDFISPEIAEEVVSKTKLFSEKCSFGTPDSRIEIPGKISHASFSEEELLEIGITTSTVRISVGLEDIEDLKNDLREALS
jgi:cystathionine beta-lyase